MVAHHFILVPYVHLMGKKNEGHVLVRGLCVGIYRIGGLDPGMLRPILIKVKDSRIHSS